MLFCHTILQSSALVSYEQCHKRHQQRHATYCPSSPPSSILVLQLLQDLAAGREAPVQVSRGEQPLWLQSSQQPVQPRQGVGLGPGQAVGPGRPRDVLSSDTTAGELPCYESSATSYCQTYCLPTSLSVCLSDFLSVCMTVCLYDCLVCVRLCVHVCTYMDGVHAYCWGCSMSAFALFGSTLSGAPQ